MSSSELQICKVEDITSLEIIKEDWNALLEENETKTVELTFEWQMTYWKHFNQNAELFVLVVRDAGSVVAIAPLKLSYIGVLGIYIRRLEFIAGGESNYQDFIIGKNNKDVLECILKYIVDVQSSWDVLYLRHIPELCTTSNLFSNKLGDYPLQRRITKGKCIFLESEMSQLDYSRKIRQSGFRKEIYRKKRKLERFLSEINLKHPQSEKQIESYLLKFFDLHRNRWNQTDTPSQFNDGRFCGFYQDVVPPLLRKRQIELSILESGAVPLALLLSFTFGKCSIPQLIAYDIDYLSYSPSMVLYEFFVLESFKNGIEMIDFGTYYPYKEIWANQVKYRVDFEIYPNRVLPQIIFFVTNMYELVKMLLSKSPFLLNFFRHLRNRIRIPGASSPQSKE